MAVITRDTVDGVGLPEASDWSDYTHTGPGTLAGRYMRMFWHPVSLSRRLSAGRAVPIRLMSEDLTLYRGASGDAHLLAFRCAHRGTQLSTGWVEGDNLRCFYHGWTYDGSGQCVEQPAEPEPFCSRVKIRGYPVREYLGCVWAYLGEGDPPPFRRYPQLEQESETCIFTPMGGRIQPFSYVNNLENDPAHVPFVHRGTQFFTDVPQIETEETDWGARDRVIFSNRVGLVHRVMPSGRFFTVPVQEGGWTEFLLLLVPVDDDSHLGFGLLMNHVESAEAGKRMLARMDAQFANPDWGVKVVDHAAAVLRGEYRIDDIEPRNNNAIVQIQDAVSQWGQRAIRGKTDERLGRSDVGVRMLRGLFERELRNLADGRPLKEWKIPERIDLAADYHG